MTHRRYDPWHIGDMTHDTRKYRSTHKIALSSILDRLLPPSHTVKYKTRCKILLYAHGVWSRCKILLYALGVCSACKIKVYDHGVWWWCVLKVSDQGIRSCCMLLLCAQGARSLLYAHAVCRTCETCAVGFLDFTGGGPSWGAYAPIPSMKLTKPYQQFFTGRPPVRSCCMTMVCDDSVWWWCMMMVCDQGVRSCCMLLLCALPARSRCMMMVYGDGVCSCCVLLLCAQGTRSCWYDSATV
jgi:hypothetical protein